MPGGCIFLNKLRELWGLQSGFFFMFIFTRNSAKSHFISGLGQLIIFTISVRCSRLIIWSARTLGYCKDYNGPNLFYAYEMGFSSPSCGVPLNLWSFPQVFGRFWLNLRIWHFPFPVSLFLDFPCFFVGWRCDCAEYRYFSRTKTEQESIILYRTKTEHFPTFSAWVA